MRDRGLPSRRPGDTVAPSAEYGPGPEGGPAPACHVGAGRSSHCEWRPTWCKRLDIDMRPLRICFCVDHWPTFYSMHGQVRYVQTLARGLVARGCEVHVVTGYPEPRDFVEDGFHVHARPAPPFRVVSRFQPGLGESYHLARAIRALHRAHRFDVVEFTNVEGAGYFGTVFPPHPVVIRVHTTAFDAYRLGIGKQHMERRFARLERWTARRADLLVTHTRTHQLQVASDYGVPAEEIRVVPHGVLRVRVEEKVTRRPRQVVSVGSASVRKGVATFLEVAEALSKTMPDARFVWAGKDLPSAPGGKTWRAHAADRYPHLSGRFEIREGLSDGEIAALYAESDAYLCTSLYESFGLTLVEAMFQSLPVVAPRTAAMAELIQHGQTGWLYEPGSRDDLLAQLTDALQPGPAREAIVRRALENSEREYTVDRMTTRMLDLYRSVT